MNATTVPSHSVALPPDYHVHTALCKHAAGTPAEFRQAAAAAGIAEMCFTDHYPDPSGYDPRHRMTLEQFPDYLTLLQPLQDGQSPVVSIGIEADYRPGGEAFLLDWLPRQSFDLVLGSVHYIIDWGFDNPDYVQVWQSADVKGVWREYFALLTSLADLRAFDVVAHLDLPKKFGHRLGDKEMKEQVQPVLDRVAAAGMAIEINTSGWRRKVNEAYPSPLILALAREREIPITFGSDSHAPKEVGYEFAKAVRSAREAGYTQSLRFQKRQPSPVPLPL